MEFRIDFIGPGQREKVPETIAVYVQHVDKKKDTASEIPERSLHEYFIIDREVFSDKELTEYLKHPTANLGILKSSLDHFIHLTTVYSNPLPIPLKSGVTIHAFVVFQTKKNKAESEETCWYSMEKNGKYISSAAIASQRRRHREIIRPRKEGTRSKTWAGEAAGKC